MTAPIFANRLCLVSIPPLNDAISSSEIPNGAP